MIKIKTNNIHSKEKHYILETIFSDILGLKISFESSQERKLRSSNCLMKKNHYSR